MSYPTKQMTVEEFKAECTARTEARKCKPVFREHGQHGWTDLGDVVEHLVANGPKPESKKGPHYIDCGDTSLSQWLVGKYDFNTGTATFFDRK